jgi:polysaccharide pyruvyl transferase WcaK-like protein
MLYNDVQKCGCEVIRCSYGGSFAIEDDFNAKIITCRRKPKCNNSKHKMIHAISRIKNKIESRLKKAIFWHSFSKKIKQCDFFVIGGGNMIMDLTPVTKSWLRFQRYVDVAKKYKKKIIVLSIGIGPFQTKDQKNQAIELLSRCDYVTYRDKASFNIGNNEERNHNHYLSLDPVFMLPKIKKNNTSNNLHATHIIGLGVINTLLFDESLDRYECVKLGFIKLIDRLLKLNKHVLVFSTEKKDYNMVNDVVNVFKSNMVSKVDIYTTNDLLDLYSRKLSFLVAARMHALIVAFTQHIPFIGLAWQQKLFSMCEIIQCEDRCFPIDLIQESIEEITMLVEDDIENAAVKKKFKTNLKKMEQRYDINNKIVKSVIDETTDNVV